jgi:hypothetical protein
MEDLPGIIGGAGVDEDVAGGGIIGGGEDSADEVPVRRVRGKTRRPPVPREGFFWGLDSFGPGVTSCGWRPWA